jgi:hypothetical protein
VVTAPQTPRTAPFEQLSHWPVQVVLQQTPSAHTPAAQSVVTEQGCPCFFKHVATELQVLAPVQVSLSSAPLTWVQVPVPHAMQVPLHCTLQQTPSVQNPLVHSVPVAHMLPVVLVAVHVVPEQKNPGTQSTLVVHWPRQAAPLAWQRR